MARIEEKLKNPVVERLDLTRHYITFDCDFACYMVLNPSSADCLEGSDIVGVPIGSWQIDAWRLLTKEDYPNRAGFSAVFVYDAALIGVDDNQRPTTRYSDVDIAHAVSGLRGQPVNITQFTCHEAMPVQITTPDKEPLTVSSQGIMYDPADSFHTKRDIDLISGLAFTLEDADKQVYSSFLSDVKNDVYSLDLSRISLNARFGKTLLRLFPSGVGTLVSLSGATPSSCIPFVPCRLLCEYGVDRAKEGALLGEVSTARAYAGSIDARLEHWDESRLDAYEKARVQMVDDFKSVKWVLRFSPYPAKEDSDDPKWNLFKPYVADKFLHTREELASLPSGSELQVSGNSPDWREFPPQDVWNEYFASYGVFSAEAYEDYRKLSDSERKASINSYFKWLESNDKDDLIKKRDEYLERLAKAEPLYEEVKSTDCLLRFILIYSYPYTAFKKDPTGASKVLCWKCGFDSQPVLSGSVQ